MKQISMCMALAMVVMAASSALAGIIPQTEVFDFPLSPGSTTLYFDQFDDLGGTRTLLSVTLELSATEAADITGENDSVLDCGLTASLSGFLTGSGLGLSTMAVLSLSEGPVPVEATDGVTGSGPDFHDFGSLSAPGSDSDVLTSGLGSFIGTGIGVLGIEIAGEGGFVISGIGDTTMVISDFHAYGEATLTYEYETETIPEPATMTLLAIGGLGLVMRRRRRA